MEDVVKAREDGRTAVEESPKYRSGSNGVVERAVQEIEGQMRALLLAVEERVGERLSPAEPLVQFIPEFAAYLVNQLAVGKDGKTAMERIKGKKATVAGVEFGEKLLYKVKLANKMEKINARWNHGIFVGVRNRSNELWIATNENKIISVRAVKRIPVEQRWGEDCVKWVTRVPWNRYKDAIDADGEVPEGVPEEERKSDKNGPENFVFVETKKKPPREFYIRKEDAEKHGYTRGCGGCSSWFRGLARQPHTEACRERFRNLMKEEAKVVNTQLSKREFEEKEIERKKRREEKKV